MHDPQHTPPLGPQFPQLSAVRWFIPEKRGGAELTPREGGGVDRCVRGGKQKRQRAWVVKAFIAPVIERGRQQAPPPTHSDLAGNPELTCPFPRREGARVIRPSLAEADLWARAYHLASSKSRYLDCIFRGSAAPTPLHPPGTRCWGRCQVREVNTVQNKHSHSEHHHESPQFTGPWGYNLPKQNITPGTQGCRTHSSIQKSIVFLRTSNASWKMKSQQPVSYPDLSSCYKATVIPPRRPSARTDNR